MPRHVLIADDQEDMRLLMRMVLVGQGWTVVAEARDGLEAVASFRAEQAQDINLVVLDQQMPGLTGVEVAEEILGEEPDQHVIIVSAYLTDDVRDRAAKAGVRACLDKNELITLPKSGLLD